MILIGSRALMLRAPKALMRAPVDFDWICTQEEFDTWVKEQSHKVEPTKIYPLNDGKKMIVEGRTNCEFEIIQPSSSSELLQSLVMNDKHSLHTSFGLIPNLDLLFTIKSSHKYLKNSPYFWKTFLDYHVMKKMGASIRPEYQEFFKLREKETYTYKLPNLNQDKKNFFSDDGLQYVWDHDSIHKAVAIFDKPAYLYYAKDNAEVQSDKAKFFACERAIQLAGVVEEAATLAIERSLVPHPGVWTPEYAWRFALSKVCSSITSGWFRSFAYENGMEIVKLYPTNYWDKFQAGIKSGLVKPYSV